MFNSTLSLSPSFCPSPTSLGTLSFLRPLLQVTALSNIPFFLPSHRPSSPSPYSIWSGHPLLLCGHGSLLHWLSSPILAPLVTVFHPCCLVLALRPPSYLPTVSGLYLVSFPFYSWSGHSLVPCGHMLILVCFLWLPYLVVSVLQSYSSANSHQGLLSVRVTRSLSLSRVLLCLLCSILLSRVKLLFFFFLILL